MAIIHAQWDVKVWAQHQLQRWYTIIVMSQWPSSSHHVYKDHIISLSVFEILSWLPIQYRIQFKLLLLINKTLHGLDLSYLTAKLSLRLNKGLRSDSLLLLNVSVSTLRLKFHGDRAFSVARATLWNALLNNIRLCATLAAFKPSLKTYLFKKAYNVWQGALFIYFTSDLILSFTFFLHYHFIVSAVSVTSHNWMLHYNIVRWLYNSYISYCLVCFICILCAAPENIMVQHYINQ